MPVPSAHCVRMILETLGLLRASCTYEVSAAFLGSAGLGRARPFNCTLQPLLSLRPFPARLPRPLVPATSSPGNSLTNVIKIAIWEEDQADCKCFSCYFSPIILILHCPERGIGMLTVHSLPETGWNRFGPSETLIKCSWLLFFFAFCDP